MAWGSRAPGQPGPYCYFRSKVLTSLHLRVIINKTTPKLSLRKGHPELFSSPLPAFSDPLEILRHSEGGGRLRASGVIMAECIDRERTVPRRSSDARGCVRSPGWQLPSLMTLRLHSGGRSWRRRQTGFYLIQTLSRHVHYILFIGAQHSPERPNCGDQGAGPARGRVSTPGGCGHLGGAVAGFRPLALGGLRKAWSVMSEG